MMGTKINGNGIEADENKGESPSAKTYHVDNAVEDCEQQKAQTSSEDGKRTGPHFLVDGKYDVPEQAQKHTAKFAGSSQISPSGSDDA
ncbi:hypothetical protein [Anaerohalosphaera lusitana]|uniref:hypothetical protein n=1 Tax=Anaerohalosphaera lusitana TaxID=1936003 RepID=UPI0011BA8CEA|nr:hypothetical protein [Anaerohalosphaera lusitana]